MLGMIDPDVVSWLDDILTSIYTWAEQLAPFVDAFAKLSDAKLSVSFANSAYLQLLFRNFLAYSLTTQA